MHELKIALVIVPYTFCKTVCKSWWTDQVKYWTMQFSAVLVVHCTDLYIVYDWAARLFT